MAKVYHNSHQRGEIRQERIWNLIEKILTNPNASCLDSSQVVELASQLEEKFSKETEEYV